MSYQWKNVCETETHYGKYAQCPLHLVTFIGGSGGGGPYCASTTAQKFLNFMQCFGKFCKIVCWRPLEDWRLLLRMKCTYFTDRISVADLHRQISDLPLPLQLGTIFFIFMQFSGHVGIPLWEILDLPLDTAT